MGAASVVFCRSNELGKKCWAKKSSVRCKAKLRNSRIRHPHYDVLEARTFGAKKCMGRKIAAIFLPNIFLPMMLRPDDKS